MRGYRREISHIVPNSDHQELRRFLRVLLDGGFHHSICLACYLTVAHVKTEETLGGLEAAHDCSGLVGVKTMSAKRREQLGGSPGV